MNADTATQLRLLDLQALDTALSQLAHRRRTLPELTAIATHAKQAADLQNDVIDAQTRLGDIAAEQKRLESDVDTVRARTARDEARLQAGGLPSRELESLQHEIATLARRQSTLEDELLDVMERAEEAETALADATRKHEEVTAQLHELEAARDATWAEIDAAIAERTPQRETLAADLPPDLLGSVREGARAERDGRRAVAATALRGLPHRAVRQRAVRRPRRRAGHGHALRQLPGDPRPYGRVRSVTVVAALRRGSPLTAPPRGQE